MITLITQTEAARRLKICNATLRRRIAAGVIEPDAVLLERSRHHAESALFDLKKLSSIRAVLNRQPDTIATR